MDFVRCNKLHGILLEELISQWAMLLHGLISYLELNLLWSRLAVKHT